MRVCSVEGCNQRHNARGYCSHHYGLYTKTVGRICSVDDCNEGSVAKNYCKKHYEQALRGLEPGQHRRSPGQGHINRDGYLVVSRKYVKKPYHRFLMEELLGRELYPHENVHHINGDRLDNRIENLELWSSSQPCGQRVEDKVAWAQEILALYAPSMLSVMPR